MTLIIRYDDRDHYQPSYVEKNCLLFRWWDSAHNRWCFFSSMKLTFKKREEGENWKQQTASTSAQPCQTTHHENWQWTRFEEWVIWRVFNPESTYILACKSNALILNIQQREFGHERKNFTTVVSVKERMMLQVNKKVSKYVFCLLLLDSMITKR